MIIVTGSLDIDPAQRDTFIEAARKVMAITRAEQGCELFALTPDLDDDGRFYLTECWASEEELDTHNAQPHTVEFRAAMGPLVKSGDITRWDGATGSKLFQQPSATA